jgi:hypothetical protein
MSARAEDPAVRVHASTALRRAGLERALARAGVTPAQPNRPSGIVVHAADDESTTAPIELAVGPDAIELTIRRPPDGPTWRVISRIVDELLAAGDGAGTSSGAAELPTRIWADSPRRKG